ncbi:PTS sugar transporter subunit IIA [Brevibacillus dissolubilis]|uniref:PTS sugar transporter subunit IIA n=1 Tax=Brevibacillus dissolubilis TaxID=1844116 RepID=UPI00210006B2|nr:PTS glucose transporter subunit IIA [Brevibacillus dissolubilis]
MLPRWMRLREKKTEEILFAPLSGKVLNMEAVPDPAFSEKKLGEGIAIEPTEGKVCSPVDGEVIYVFPTRHAIGIGSKSGLELLIHIGVDTVFMDGLGFKEFVKEGDRVKTGQPLLEFSLDLVKQKATSMITPIVITNPNQVDRLEILSPTLAQMGTTPVMKISMKTKVWRTP